MTNIKCFFLRLYLLTYSPIFPVLLGSTIFIVYRIYFEPVILCEGWDVMNLKYEITKEVSSYRIADIKVQEYIDRRMQLERMPRTDSVQRELQIVLEEQRAWIDITINHLSKVRSLEDSLRLLGSNYRTVITTHPMHPRVYDAS